MSGGSGRGTAYDGRWNSGLGVYVLPPLIGLPFHDMVKNGEGLRHADNPKYYQLIVVHAVFMAIPFLFLIPAAIFSHRFKRHETPRQAIQWHFILNSISLLSLTVGFAAGWFAVNKGEWADNPHHIIGVTLYAGLMIQAAFGLIVRGSERKKIRKLGQVGLKAMLHMWFGRGLWLLGLAQIPLGLYLYGSPLVLFILYAIVTLLVFVTYFVLEYVHNRRTAKYQPAPGGIVGSVRGGLARTSDGSHPSNRRSGTHSGVSYTEMTENTHPAPTATTPGTFDTRTSFEGREGTELFTSNGSRFGNDHHHNNMPTTPKMGRLNRLSQSLGNRFRRGVSGFEVRNIGGYGGTPNSFDPSTRPPTGSTANRLSGGLHAPPNNRPPLPAIGGQIAAMGALEQHHHFRRNDAARDPLKDGHGQVNNRVELPVLGQTATGTGTGTGTHNSSVISPVSPSSSGFVKMPPLPNPQSDVSSLSSDRPGAKYAGGHLFSPLLPPSKITKGEVPMPLSPLGDTYLSDGLESPLPQRSKYPPLLPTNPPPRVPLPMPPEPPRQSNPHHSHHSHHSHHRAPSDASTQPDAVIRIPLHRNSDTINVPAGELIRNNLPHGEHPQVSVQVKVDRAGRSVTVRRLPAEEAALARQQRQQERAAKAQERERAIDIGAQQKSTGAGAGVSEVSGDTGVTTVSSGTLPHVSQPQQATSLRPSDANRANMPASPLDSYSDDDYTSDEEDYNPPMAGESVIGSRISGVGGAGRESVVSAAATDDAEAEEKIRERRRRKRREERKEGGLTGAELTGGTYYGAGGESRTGTGSLTRDLEWT